MAAGGVEVLRREDSRFPRKDFGYGESGSRVGNGVDRSGDAGSRPKRFYGRSEERELGRFSSAGNGERSKVEDVGLLELSREKKRKISPIVWDKEEKDVRVFSKKRVAELDYVSDGEVLNSDIFESDNQVEEVGFSTHETATVDGLLQQPEVDLCRIQDGAEGEELVLERTISMSRWASEDDTLQHMSDGECTPHRERSSSTESGEFHSGGSSGIRSGLSGSDSGYGSGGSNFDCGSEDDDEDSKIDEPTICPRVNMLQSCRNVFEYEKVNKINEGTYGVVYKAKDKKTGEIVALKKVKMDVTSDEYGFPLSSLREINILLSFRHPSIVNVKEVAMDDNDGVYMVMEHMEHDLKGLSEKMKEPFSIGEAKLLMLQLLEGVKYLHDNWVLHRDLKTSNLLLNEDGTLKICDFGMSRQYGSPRKPYTALVVTLWYRAPELLLGTKEYSTAVDMWSVGCIMAELIAKCPLFRGKNEVEQLDKIFRTLGTPNESIWPGFSKLPGSKAKFVKQPFNTLRKKFPATSFTGSPALTDLGFDLLSRLLSYDPDTRITAEEALNHRWFVEAPLPATGLRPSIFESQSQRRYLGRGQ